MLEQQLADAATLLGVLDEERDLGPARVVDLVAARRAMIRFFSVTTNATRCTWSTWVNRCTSRSDSRGIAVKNRKYFDWSETRS